MLNPISLPAELVQQVQALSEAVRCLPSIERMLDTRRGRLESRLESLPDDIEAALRDHFERQQQGVASMHGELRANREAAEQLPPGVEGLLERIDALRGELSANREAAEAVPARLEALRGELRQVLDEITRIRETLEPLQGPAERLARMDERLPGGS
jgi:chromosome segregation ATPase